MGFISFNQAYYLGKLEYFENKSLTSQDLYSIQELLKVLDDLVDEGYTHLSTYLENEFSCITRLHRLIKKAGGSPFPIDPRPTQDVSYAQEEVELQQMLEILLREAHKNSSCSDSPFLNSIAEYAQWIGYENDTAYVFLLRDTLLPYVYFKSRHRERIYPWLINRHFLKDITQVENVDDEIRLPIYEALESGHTTYEDFCLFCQEKILQVLDRYSFLKQVLCDLLQSIKEKNIVVVESGYAGTIPMMLKALDNRVRFRLYTTAPFLYKTYENLIFCRQYRDLRKFETVYSQDFLIRFSSYRDGKFYVNFSNNKGIQNKSWTEIRYFTSFCSNM